MNDQPRAETTTRQHTTLKRTDVYTRAGCEPSVPASEWLQTHTVDGADAEIDLPSYKYSDASANEDNSFRNHIR